jgi:hypothetical protein
MDYADMPHQRVLTEEELAALMESFRDPESRARMLEDARRAEWVEVDNPVRREVRPRRGTDET